MGEPVQCWVIITVLSFLHFNPTLRMKTCLLWSLLWRMQGEVFHSSGSSRSGEEKSVLTVVGPGIIHDLIGGAVDGGPGWGCC